MALIKPLTKLSVLFVLYGVYIVLPFPEITNLHSYTIQVLAWLKIFKSPGSTENSLFPAKKITEEKLT